MSELDQTIHDLSNFDLQLLDQYQRNFPLCERPFKFIAESFDVTENRVIERYKFLEKQGYISRIGVVLDPAQIGASTLAAVHVESSMLDSVAYQISLLDGVNHNYQREHFYNLWFVITAPNQHTLQEVIKNAEKITHTRVLSLPMIKRFHIDLGFKLCSSN
ncbi:MAG: AsnC family protein [Gammaproteobacteria bacterium CG22_combo_CG10-13_8_21_14_all_40_8]|nr:MAG: AsnC family protein [Gammaproteobacteria bacterium CG22_combo_CG10-13_8_21_14_all_40_8]